MPDIVYRFPQSLATQHDGAAGDAAPADSWISAVPQFCFPDLHRVRPVEELASETFSFVLTDMSGMRRVGYSRRILPMGSGPRLPEVYCIVSSERCFGLFAKILDEVERRRRVASRFVQLLL